MKRAGSLPDMVEAARIQNEKEKALSMASAMKEAQQAASGPHPLPQEYSLPQRESWQRPMTSVSSDPSCLALQL